jgi:Starch-binding associating with outer membrane
MNPAGAGLPIKKEQMKITNRRTIIGALGIGSLLATGCKKQLDINHNPNFPLVPQGNEVLYFPVGVVGTLAGVGGVLEISGGMLSQFFTQASGSQQYTDVDTYNMPPTDPFVIGGWQTLYTNGLINEQFAIDKAKENADWNLYLMATVMKVYTTQVLVDLYDQIPYTQALQGSANLTPSFDDGFSVYKNLLASLDTALAGDFSAASNVNPGKQDLVFGGNMGEWLQFANTLKLKIYLRMINSQPDMAETGVKALVDAGGPFLQQDASVTNFTDAPGLDNPFYEQDKRQLNTPDNLRASTTFTSWLNTNGDPRVVYYFQAPGTTSINQGDFASNSNAYAAAPIFRNDDHTSATDPVVFISAAESYFLQAEADVRYYGGTQAKQLYEQGVLAAFAATGNDGSSFIAPGGAYEWGKEMEGGQPLGAIEQIIRQKWASCAFGCHAIESFFEKNRTGFPKTSAVYSDDPSYIPGQLVIVKSSVLPPGIMPQRFVFPYTETTVNPKAPALVPSTTPVWWAQ